jgi:arginine-tRNA-protein transferase
MEEIGSFTTEPEPCPYLPERDASSQYRLIIGLSPKEYGGLLAEGWRRFGQVIFRPRCPSCSECVPIRVPVEGFRPSKSQRRCLRRNRDVTLEVGEPTIDEERLDLYRRHHAEREQTRSWRPSRMTAEDYHQSFVLNTVRTLEFRYRIDERLVGIAYVGAAEDALNSIYAFTDPDESRRGLGNLDVLREIETAKSLSLKYLYLGFLVVGCPSMEYKSDFRPYELRREGEWRLFDTD